MINTEKTMDKIVALCKGRGFVYPGSEIYGGVGGGRGDGVWRIHGTTGLWAWS